MRCSIPGCERTTTAKGMCDAHYRRWRKHGDSGSKPIATKASDGEPMQYLLAHMYDGCCCPWPYGKDHGGYIKMTEGSGHRIVCEIVNGPAQEGQVARHLCGKGHLGCFNADCLAWGSRTDDRQDMVRHGTRLYGEQHQNTVLPKKDVDSIRMMYATGNYSESILGEMFGISRGHVNCIIKYKRRKNG